MLKLLLIVVQGKPEGKTIPVSGPVFRIGRGLDCHLRPNSEEVSRNHTEIVLSKTDAVVRDLGSRNGTRVNGKLLTGPHKLKSGELLQVGPLTFAIAIQGVSADAEEPRGVAPPVGTGIRPGSTSLDDVPADQIDAWLVSDNSKPTPDRPSGVYDGDTLTLESYKEVVNRARQAGSSSGSIPTMPAAPTASAPTPAPAAPAAPAPVAPAPAPPPVAASRPTPPPVEPEAASPFDAILESIERLPEGTGDAAPTSLADPGEEHEEREDADDEGDSGENEMEDEFVDESNPFYAAKKAAKGGGESAEPAKPSYQDSSQAASDILKKMLERRRAPR